MLDLVLSPNQWRLTFRTPGRKFEGRRCKKAFIMGSRGVDSDNLGNDLPTLLNKHPIADSQAQLGNLICIVKGRVLHCGPSQLNGLKLRHGCHSPRAPHLVLDIDELGACALRFKLVGNGPTWAFGSHPESSLVIVAIHLDDNAIDIIS